MRADALFRLLFILYCVEVGVLLLLLPWGSNWERVAFQLPGSGCRDLALSPWSRGALSGFGVVHLVWGVHEITGWFQRRSGAARPAR